MSIIENMKNKKLTCHGKLTKLFGQFTNIISPTIGNVYRLNLYNTTEWRDAMVCHRLDDPHFIKCVTRLKAMSKQLYKLVDINTYGSTKEYIFESIRLPGERYSMFLTLLSDI